MSGTNERHNYTCLWIASIRNFELYVPLTVVFIVCLECRNISRDKKEAKCAGKDEQFDVIFGIVVDHSYILITVGISTN